jgi:hypothetical protein
MKALILNGKVVDINETRFPVAPELTWVDCAQEVKVNWLYSDGVFSVPPIVIYPPSSVELTYAQKRAAEYPPMTDYLDGVVKGDQAQINKYIADCQAVKTKYPKG